MTERRCQFIGLTGFILSGVIFIIVGLRADDMLTVAGSALWTCSCLVWMIPLFRDKNG